MSGVNMKFYVMAHYSRHIRPGMEIIDGGEGNTVAAYDSSRGKNQCQTFPVIHTDVHYKVGPWLRELSNTARGRCIW